MIDQLRTLLAKLITALNIGPLGTWAIVKRYPNTDRAVWVCIGLTGAGVGIMALLRLVALLWA